MASQHWKKSRKVDRWRGASSLLLPAVFLIFSSALFSQSTPDTFALVRTYPESAVYFEVDKLQQVYLVQEDNTIIKYQPDGSEAFRYNDNTRGKLAYLEVTDPFNVLLFYPEFQAVTSLDRTMNERGNLLLYTTPVVNASAIGLARDNNIWVYDQAAFVLYKLAPNGESILSSSNLSAQLTEAPQISQVVARSNMVYLLSPEQGIFVFDNFTQFHQLLPYKGQDYLQVQEPLLLLSSLEGSIAYHTKRLQDFYPPLPPQAKDAKEIRWMGTHCYLLMPDDKVSVYKKLK
jgi:hypothetical protein